MSDEEIRQYRELEELRFSILTDLLSGDAGNTPFAIVYERYKQLKRAFFDTDSYFIPNEIKNAQALYLDDIPLAFYDCWLDKEKLLSKNFDYIEEFAKIYVKCYSVNNQWHSPINVFDFVNEGTWPQLSKFKIDLTGNINIYLKSLIRQSNGCLTIRQYLYEIGRYINDNKFMFASHSVNVNIPYLNNPFLSHAATISYYSCSTIGDSYKELKPLRGCTSSSIKCFYQNFKDAKVPFEDEFVGIWYDKTLQYSNRKTWLHGLFLITKKGYYIPVKSIIDSNEPQYSDSQPSESYGIFLSGAIRMAFSYAYTENVSETLTYLLKLIKDSKISIVRNRNSQYQFIYSLPWYSWVKE